MKGDIVFSEDIIRNVAAKLGVPERKVKHVFDFLFLHIRKLSKEPDVFSIKIPLVGRLYFSSERMRLANIDKEKRDSVSKRQKATHKISKQKVETFENLYKDKAKGGYLRTVHKKRSNLNCFLYTKGMGIKQLEMSQNEYEES